jgi:hypothetical protein
MRGTRPGVNSSATTSLVISIGVHSTMVCDDRSFAPANALAGNLELQRFTMARMPTPGEPCPGFMSEAGRCWRMLYDRNLQATHCTERTSCTGRWFSPRGDRWWLVWACPDHLEGLTGLRQFGGRP